MELYTEETSKHPFTELQWQTLLALVDTFLPALDDREVNVIMEETASTLIRPQLDKVEVYLRTSAVDDPDVDKFLQFQFAKRFSSSTTNRISFILDQLSGGVSTYLFCNTTTAFHVLPRQQRELIILSWSNAYFRVYREVFHRLKAIIISTYLQSSMLAREAMQYPRLPLQNPDTRHQWCKPLPQMVFEQIDIHSTLEADAIIVGSGCGGAVVAARLAQSGLRTIVVDKGSYVAHEGSLTSESEERIEQHQLNETVATEDGAGTMLAASCWGGGSEANWGASLQLHHDIRKEWAEELGIDFVTTDAFQDCQERVCNRMGVSTDNVKHNFVNQALIDGARKLGYQSMIAPRNCTGQRHGCGFSGYGCSSGEKQSCTTTWLADAQSAGARFVQNCWVEDVIIKGGKVHGVNAIVNGKTQLVLRAPKVVLSAGSLRSPCILQRSEIKNSNIGLNLKLHPSVAFLGAWYGKETKPWESGVVTSMVTDLDNRDGRGYGGKIMPMVLSPTISWSSVDWYGAAAWKKNLLYYSQSCGVAIVSRDRDSSGEVKWDFESQKPKVRYSLAEFDRETILEGLITAAEIIVAAGADEVFSMATGWPSYVVDKKNPQGGGGTTDPRFKAYITTIRRIVMQRPYYSVHQMSTCRMGTSPASSVVNQEGEVWGISGLYVADASVLPTATGGNPTIPTMAMAKWIAEQIVSRW